MARDRAAWSADFDLDGWGDIARHIRRSARTAQRWADRRHTPMPVWRLPSGMIVASSTAIDAWIDVEIVRRDVFRRKMTDVGRR